MILMIFMKKHLIILTEIIFEILFSLIENI